jgi:hypothetical protein
MNDWTSEWPTEASRYWLFARVWGDEEPKLYHVEVWKIANGFAYVCNGHFLGRNDVKGEPAWQPITLPELPA